MHWPTSIFWANLTACSLQRAAAEAEGGGDHLTAEAKAKWRDPEVQKNVRWLAEVCAAISDHNRNEVLKR